MLPSTSRTEEAYDNNSGDFFIYPVRSRILFISVINGAKNVIRQDNFQQHLDTLFEPILKECKNESLKDNAAFDLGRTRL
jgi:hypothetical protein